MTWPELPARGNPRVRDGGVALGLGLALGVPVLVLVIASAWSGVYGQDAYAYHGYATGELREAILAARPPGPFPWPPAYPALVALVSLVTGPTTVAGQAVSLVAAMLVVVLTWALAREVARQVGWRPWIAPLAGVIVALTPHLWQSAAVVMSDTTGLAAMTLGAWALVRWAGGGRLRWAVLGAVAIAFAIDTRQIYALAALVPAMAALGVGWRRSPTGTDRIRTLGVPLLAGALVLAPVVGPTVWAGIHGEPLPFAVSLTSHPWSLGNVVRDVTVGADGVQRWPLPMGLWALLQPLQPYHLGPVVGALAWVGGARVLIRVRDALPVAVLIGWPILVLLVLAGDVIQNTRFALALLPPAAILAATGVEGIVGRLERRSGMVGRWAGRGAAVLVVGVLALQAVGAVRFTGGFIDRFSADGRTLATLDAGIPRDDRVLAFAATLALRFAGRDAVGLETLSPADALAVAADGRRTWVIIPADTFADQWGSAPVGRTFAALQGGPGLTFVERRGGWELWRVEGSTDSSRDGARAGPAASAAPAS